MSQEITRRSDGSLACRHCADRGLERGALAQYRQLVELHIKPHLGATKLSTLTIPLVRQFEDDLHAAGRSPAMIKKALVALSSVLSDAQEGGLVVRNVVRDLWTRRTRPDKKRHRARLQVGVDIPSREEVKAVVGALRGRWRPLLLTAIFTGLRASELRGLRWSDVDLDKTEIHVRQRADRFNDIGRPKSETSERTVPIPPLVVNTLREWKLACPRRATKEIGPDGEPVKELHLVFPNGQGKVEVIGNIVKRGLQPAMIAGGVVRDTGEKDAEGKPVVVAKYSGMHALRHFYASWCINRPTDGGLGLPIKVVQERLGHSSIMLTSDRYGHLFPRGDDADEMAAAERSLLS
ncbi:site-specific integrase [Mesorhizobium waimense]|uniref:Site-specific integrase n=1 Tax=Mesorhizobium waimense TaxID=1300307 RepID=A0A3A5K5X2_9HYPH|nr:site-specific integrase [Mesorhizobium waimense]